MGISLDLTKLAERRRLVEDIKSGDNKGRKAISLRQLQIFNDDIWQHVWERIARRFSPCTAEQMPIVKSINIAKKIVKQEASIYQNSPERSYTEVSEDQEDVLNSIYRGMGFNSKMMKSNEMFKLQAQNHLMIVPKDGKLIMRVLANHHVDKIDDTDDPETAAGYVISAVDKSFLVENRRSSSNRGSGFTGRFDAFADNNSDRVDQSVGDPEDYKEASERYVVWTKEYNFIMNGKGVIVSGEDISSPIPGVLPIIEVSPPCKDFEYWVTNGDPLGEFTIEYNTLMSDISNIVMHQGYAQGVLIAKDDIIPDNIQLGPNFILKLPIENAEDPRPEFAFAQPGSDISGSLDYADRLLVNFLSTRGSDVDAVVSSPGNARTATSGIQEFLQMIKRFEATKQDFDIYKWAEMQVYDVVKEWHNSLIGTGLLDNKFQGPRINDDSEVMVNFSGPEMVQTNQEKVDVWRNKIEAGLASRVDAIMDLKGVTREEAEEQISRIESEEMSMGVNGGASANQQEGVNQDS